MSCAKTAEPIVMPFGLVTRGEPEPKEPCRLIRWGSYPHENGNLMGTGAARCKV